MYTVNPKINNQLSLWLITMFIIISIMIVVGGLTRLTDSGLSITQWELFSGFLPPINEIQWQNYFDLYKKIPEFKLQNFSMSLEEFKVIFWWEWIHRFLGRLIGLSFLLPLIYFSFKAGFKNLIKYKNSILKEKLEIHVGDVIINQESIINLEKKWRDGVYSR